jgi:hypothetical protein
MAEINRIDKVHVMSYLNYNVLDGASINLALLLCRMKNNDEISRIYNSR